MALFLLNFLKIKNLSLGSVEIITKSKSLLDGKFLLREKLGILFLRSNFLIFESFFKSVSTRKKKSYF